MRSLLTPAHAEYLIRFTNSDTELMAQCVRLANRSVSLPTITDWLKVRMGLVSFKVSGYQMCEVILKASEGDRQ